MYISSTNHMTTYTKTIIKTNTNPTSSDIKTYSPIDIKDTKNEKPYKNFCIAKENLNPELYDKLQKLWEKSETDEEKEKFIDMYAFTFCPSVCDSNKWTSDWRKSLQETIDYRRSCISSLPAESQILIQEHEKWFNKLLS